MPVIIEQVEITQKLLLSRYVFPHSDISSIISRLLNIIYYAQNMTEHIEAQLIFAWHDIVAIDIEYVDNILFTKYSFYPLICLASVHTDCCYSAITINICRTNYQFFVEIMPCDCFDDELILKCELTFNINLRELREIFAICYENNLYLQKDTTCNIIF